MRRQALMMLAALLAALLCELPAAIADEYDDEDSPAERDRQAKELFYAGEKHYAAGRYQRAAMLYEEAYELSKRPELLFNMANAFERLGEFSKAARYLRRYLRSDAAEDVVSIRQRVERLEARAEEERAKRARLAALRKREARGEFIGPPDEGEKLTTKERWAYVALAGGGAGLVSAVVFAVASASAGRDANQLCSGDLCPSTARGALDRQKRFAILTDVSAVIGLASAGVGAYLLWRARREKAEEQERTSVRFDTQIYRGGIGVGVAGEF